MYAGLYYIYIRRYRRRRAETAAPRSRPGPVTSVAPQTAKCASFAEYCDIESANLSTARIWIESPENNRLRGPCALVRRPGRGGYFRHTIHCEIRRIDRATPARWYISRRLLRATGLHPTPPLCLQRGGWPTIHSASAFRRAPRAPYPIDSSSSNAVACREEPPTPSIRQGPRHRRMPRSADAMGDRRIDYCYGEMLGGTRAALMGAIGRDRA